MSKTLKNRGGGLYDWFLTKVGLDRSYATQRASSKTRRRRQKVITGLYNFSMRPKSRSRSSRSGSKNKTSEK